MIRHAYDSDAVQAAVGAIDARWIKKARTRVSKLLAKGRYEEASSIWSVVKPVYMRLQHYKCVFCERQFEDAQFGPIEWDLEHFRPKSNVAVWPDPVRHPGLNYGADLGAAAPEGYYWLAYTLENYAASCKVCNTIFKLNYFPVAAARGAVGDLAQSLRDEQALLCYPFGDLDDDPETLVSFVLTTAVPTQTTGAAALRGRVIIDFFGLNRRDILHRERARMISLVGAAYTQRDSGLATPQMLAMIQRLEEPQIPHAACVRAFARLWHDDPVMAQRGYQACLQFGFDPAAAPPSL